MIPSVVHLVGWTLVHSLWQGALVALAEVQTGELHPRRVFNFRPATLTAGGDR